MPRPLPLLRTHDSCIRRCINCNIISDSIKIVRKKKETWIYGLFLLAFQLCSGSPGTKNVIIPEIVTTPAIDRLLYRVCPKGDKDLRHSPDLSV